MAKESIIFNPEATTEAINNIDKLVFEVKKHSSTTADTVSKGKTFQAATLASISCSTVVYSMNRLNTKISGFLQTALDNFLEADENE